MKWLRYYICKFRGHRFEHGDDFTESPAPPFSFKVDNLLYFSNEKTKVRFHKDRFCQYCGLREVAWSSEWQALSKDYQPLQFYQPKQENDGE